MKQLFFIFTVILISISLYAFGKNSNDLATGNEDMKWTVILEYQDGTTETRILTHDEVLELNNADLAPLASCTYQTTNGDCKFTEADCNTAYIKHRDCLCEMGYDGWCGRPRPEDPGN